MSVADDDDTVSRSGIWRATCFCILQNPYHLCTNGFRHHRAAARSSDRSRVMGWCTVATTGSPASAMVSRPVPRLWLSCTTSNSSRRSASSRAARRRESAGLGKAGGPHGGQFEQVDAIADLAGPRHAERVGLAVEVQAGNLGQPHPGIEHLGVGLAGEHLDVVAQFDQTAAEVPHVDALSAAVGLAPIGQQRNSHTQPFAASDRPRRGANLIAVNAPGNDATANWTCVQIIVCSANRRKRTSTDRDPLRRHASKPEPIGELPMTPHPRPDNPNPSLITPAAVLNPSTLRQSRLKLRQPPPRARTSGA